MAVTRTAVATAPELPDAGPRIKMMETVTMATIVAMVAGFVLYPIYYLVQASLDVGVADARPPTAYGTANYAKLLDYPQIIWNTFAVTSISTLMALLFGFVGAWILTRTNVPFKRTLDQLMTVPYYVTPLLGALAWSFLGAPESGFINQAWRKLGGSEALIDITSPLGIAWVMALFEGSVAYVMISAVMQSMDPALEEASQVMGGSKWRTMWRITLPLVAPGVLGAAIFVFAEMLGSFSVALVLGTPARFYVITTAIYHFVSQYPPRIPLAAAFGVALFVVILRYTAGLTPGSSPLTLAAMETPAWWWQAWLPPTSNWVVGAGAFAAALALLLPWVAGQTREDRTMGTDQPERVE